MPSYKTTSLFFLILIWLNLAFSQNYPGRNYTAANELPNNTVRSLLVDSNNILWIGTDNGIVKKENDVFNYFFEEDGLALNSCWAIAEDSNQKLWFGSYGKGLSIYDGTGFKIISREEGLVHNEVTKLYSSGDKVFVGTSDGVSVIDINTFKVSSPEIPEGDELFRILDFFEYKAQVYAIVYNYGVFEIREENDQIKLNRIKDHKNLYSVLKRNDSIYSSHKGFYAKTTIEDFLRKKDPCIPNKSGQSIIWDFAETRKNKIFAAAWGIYDNSGGIYEIVNGELISRAADFNIPSNEVISLAYDNRFEKLYVGSRDSGMYEVSLDPQIKFHKIEGQKVLGFARTDHTNGILLDNSILIENAKRPISISLAQLKKWQQDYLKRNKLPEPRSEIDFYELDFSIEAKNIDFYDIKANRNNYWLNTNIGIFAINDSGNLVRYLPLHSEEINFTTKGELVETHPYGGVRVYKDLDDFEYIYFRKDSTSTPTLVVNSLLNRDKTYLLSVFSGLYRWNGNKFISYVAEDIWKENKLRHITPIDDKLAISNEFGDVFIVKDDEKFEVLQKIPRADIEGNTISFLKSIHGILLIGTEKGLTIIKDGRQIFMNAEQGLQQPLFSAEIQGENLIIGSADGFYFIDIAKVIASNTLINDLRLKEIFINNNQLPKQYKKDGVLSLPYNENTVLLNFSTNAHPYPNKLSYQYRLNKEEDWSLPSEKPEIFLPFLPSRNYEIDVKVLDNSTGLNYTGSLIQFSILPPYWKTWWFSLLLVIILLSGITLIYQHQIRQTKKFEAQKRLIQKRFEETKMEALLAQMNPHFIFNAMNSIQNYIMDSDIDNATMFLGDFAKLIRLNLDHCTKPTILLIQEIEYLQSYIRVENTRFNNKIKVLMEIDPEIDTYEIEIPTMILQTFVENVFVHAFPNGLENPTLKVSFNLEDQNTLLCKICDNGIGFSSESKNSLHSSKGVSLVKERLAILGYNVAEAIQVRSEKNKGTSVNIRLKI
ncbi:sensor histidine kinase [Christiangramia sabulilitoris]|uniref:Histidine kinase n=1 Tax=Christiangramia sabulilitoris TaxID=2583991 RepID=A0A550I7N1_9FLAO|nr:histidine kinase [Christiangramia sabulilitoris]TRO66982.1 histidine kinase [Christiangramia sabulilitoris]